MRARRHTMSSYLLFASICALCAALSTLIASPAFAQDSSASNSSTQGGGVQPLVALSVDYYTPCVGTANTGISIYGSSFGSSQGTGYVLFTGTATHAQIQNWSDTLIMANVPSGATSGPITVYANGGVMHASGPAFVVGTASINPTSGAVGTAVAASNTCFTATSVKFNNVTASFTQSTYTVNTTVPTGATTGPMVVSGSTGGHSYSNSWTFTVTAPAPSITSASPNPTTVGTSVTIGGSNFGSSRGTSTVSFNGTAATTYGTWGPTSVQATVPSGATSGNLVVTVGGVASNNWSFTVTPQITNLSVTTGTRGTAFTITGTGFGGTKGSSTVTVGGATATTTSWGATSIATSVPNAAPIGADNVIVTVNGVASNASVFTVTKIATSTALVSNSNPSIYGGDVTFTATVTPGAATGTVTFKDGSTALNTVNLSGGVATLTIPWLNVGTHPITAVYNGDGNYDVSTSNVVSQVVNGLAIAVPPTCILHP